MKKLPTFIRQNWPLKLAAVLLAGIIYTSVRFQLQTEETFTDVEVQIRTKGSRIAVIQGEALTTNITVRGTKRSLNKLKNNPTVEHLIPATTPPGPYPFRLRPDDVKLPGGVNIAPDGIQPADFQVQLDRVVQEEARIRLRMIREGLPSDLAIRKVTVHPKKATISGPERYIGDINEVVTEEVTFDKDPPLSYELNVALKPIPHVTIKPRSVRVSIELSRSKDTRLYRGIPIEVLTGDDSKLYVKEFIDAQTGKPTVDVTLEGPAATLDFLTAASIRAFIELSEEDGVGTYNLPVRIWVYVKDCSVQTHAPTTVKVRVARRP